jgi:hypothetical protein
MTHNKTTLLNTLLVREEMDAHVLKKFHSYQLVNQLQILKKLLLKHLLRKLKKLQLKRLQKNNHLQVE